MVAAVAGAEGFAIAAADEGFGFGGQSVNFCMF